VFFIKQWLPELAEFQWMVPWKLNMIEQQFYDCEIGIIILSHCKYWRNYTSDIVWVSVKKTKWRGGKRIEKHVSNPNQEKTRKKNCNDYFLAKWQ
jgi:deoxyribodipyrimidine photo-lyase